MACRCLAYTLLLVALLIPPALSRGSRKLLKTPIQTLSGKALVIAQDYHGKPSSRMLALRTDKGQRVQVMLDDLSKLAGISTGMKLELTGQWQPRQQQQAGTAGVVRAGASSSSTGTFKATSIRAWQDGSVAAASTTTVSSGGSNSDGRVAAASLGPNPLMSPAPSYSTNKLVNTDVAALFIPIAAVGANGAACPGSSRPKLTANDVRKTALSDVGPSVASTINTCSYNRTRMNNKNSRVADLVELPCSGTTSGGTAWSFNSCTFDDIFAWAEAADAAARAQGIVLEKYRHRVYLVPPGACGSAWVGMGYLGCDTTECRSWIGGDFWGSPQSMLHELGHNLFLQHAGSVVADGTFDEYGDDTCGMGYCCDQRCFNTPHAWQMGWITVQQLDGSSVRAGQTVQVNIASQSTTQRSGLRIVPSWVAGADPIFLGFRTAAGIDAAMEPGLLNKLHMYTAPITGTYDPQFTTWRGALDVGQSWAHPTTGVVVRMKTVAAGSAVVSVCRKGGAETAATCAAGVDNDCNGLAGPSDPACFSFIKRPAVSGF